MVSCINVDDEMPSIQCHKCPGHTEHLASQPMPRVCSGEESTVWSPVVRHGRPGGSAGDQFLYLTAITVGDQCVCPSLSPPFALTREASDGWALLDAAVSPTVKGY